MKRPCFLLLALAMASCRPSEFSAPVNIPPKITSFITQKEQHARALAMMRADEKVPSDVWKYFQLAREGRWRAARRVFEELRERCGQVESLKYYPEFTSPTWHALLDVQLALDAYANGEPKYPTAFGEGIVQSIPRGSIYFGGTDSGRSLPTAFSNSHADGDPFFTLAQNALADGRYVNYIHDTYGGKIQTPTDADLQQWFQNYLADAQKRLDHDRKSPGEPRQLNPDEDKRIANYKVEVLTKVIFDRNPEREFYVEESFPLDWMYPHLTPHGLIMKLHREPLPSIPSEVIAKDREFWTQQQAAMIGDWLTPDTSVKEVCEFAEKVFLRKDLSRFRGDPAFVRSDYATTMYSKLRSSLGGLYSWRIAKSRSSEEQQRMILEADFAFRQAFALCPVSPEAIYRYVNLLVQLNRIDDTLLIARTAQRLSPKDSQLQNLITELERIRSAKPM
jgi:hypothetical protein